MPFLDEHSRPPAACPSIVNSKALGMNTLLYLYLEVVGWGLSCHCLLCFFLHQYCVYWTAFFITKTKDGLRMHIRTLFFPFWALIVLWSFLCQFHLKAYWFPMARLNRSCKASCWMVKIFSPTKWFTSEQLVSATGESMDHCVSQPSVTKNCLGLFKCLLRRMEMHFEMYLCCLHMQMMHSSLQSWSRVTWAEKLAQFKTPEQLWGLIMW